MKDEELNKKIAYLEFVNDQLTAEIEEIDFLMKEVGFQYGLETVKATAQEIYENDQSDEIDDYEAM